MDYMAKFCELLLLAISDKWLPKHLIVCLEVTNVLLDMLDED
jgi:hypothetical protein